jgi:hypothetical protein
VAIAFDAVVPHGGSSTWSHTCSGSNRILFVLTRGAVTAVTYAGVALTQIGSLTITPVGDPLKVWRLYAPATGANTVALTGGDTDAYSVSYTGAAQSGTQVVTTNLSSSSATSLTTSITTVDDNSWVLVSEAGYAFGSAPSAGTGLTLRGSGTSSNIPCLFDSNGPQTPAGSFSGTTTISSSAGYPIYHLMVAFAPAVATVDPRLTQLVVETLTFAPPAVAVARATQLVAETLTSTAAAVTDARVTQVVTELLTSNPPLAPRVTQLAVETLTNWTIVPANVTQLAVETLDVVPNSPLAVTQVAAELLKRAEPAEARVTQLACELIVIVYEPPACSGSTATFPIDPDD